nr:polyamine transporter 4 [Quercus suber]
MSEPTNRDHHQQHSEKPNHARDWDGANDPANPRNFSLARRVSSTIFVTLLAFVTTFGAAAYSGGIGDVATDFQVSEEVAILPLSLFNLGLAFGPMLGSPLSEQFGRKVVVMITTPIFALFVLGAGLSKSIAALCICRFLAGMFASPAVSNAAATIMDYTAARYRGVSLSIYYTATGTGANVGPLVGGYAALTEGWRWTQFVTIFFIVAFYIPVLSTKETYKKTILKRKAKRLGIEVPPEPHRTISGSLHHFTTVLFLRPVHMLLTEPIVSLVCLYSSFLFGLLYTFVVASPWIWKNYYDFSRPQQNLSFLGLIVGAVCAPLLLIVLDYYLYQPRLKTFRQTHTVEKSFAPEHRLYPAMLVSFALPAALFVFAWTVRPGIPWICPIIFQGLVMMFSLMIYAPANLYLIDFYGPKYGASASGAATLSRYTLSAVFPLFSLQMYRALGVGWATSILAFCSLAMAPIPWLFWRWGQKLRSRTRYEIST